MQTVIIHGRKFEDFSPKRRHPDAALWVCTRAIPHFWHGRLTDWDECFDLHPLVKTERFDGIEKRRPEAWRWYAQQDGTRPIWMQAEHPAIKASRRFPIDDIIRYADTVLDPHERDGRMFICQIGMMICSALLRGFEHVILNGVGTPKNVDHQHLHRDINYWKGVLHGQGKRLTIEGPSTFRAPAHIYAYERLGYDELDQARREARLGISAEQQEQLEEENERERRRGRPARRRVGAV